MALYFRDPNSTPPPAGTPSTTGYLGQLASSLGVQFGGVPSGGPQSQQPTTVYLGAPQHEAQKGSALDQLGGPLGALLKGDKVGSAPAMLMDFEKLSKEEQRKMALLLVLGGYGPKAALEDVGKTAANMTLGMTLDAYSELILDAAGKYAIGQKVTPDQLLRQAINFRLPKGLSWDGKSSIEGILGKAGVDVGPADLSGTHTTTSKNKSVDFMDPMDAKGLARGVLQQELGRDPTQAEYEDFIAAIHAAEARNPDVTTQTNTVTTDREGRVVDSNTSSVTHQGMSGTGYAQLALEKAQSNPNWAEWQAMGTYAPALFQALSTAVPGV